MLPQGMQRGVRFKSSSLTVADPGFPRGGGVNPQRGGASTYDFANVFKNCIKFKEFGTPGGRGSKILLCRSTTTLNLRCDALVSGLKSITHIYQVSRFHGASFWHSTPGLGVKMFNAGINTDDLSEWYYYKSI